MKLNGTQSAIISALHQEPWYRFTGSERRAAERMHRLGYLKPLKSKPIMTEGVERGGLRFSVTKKGEQAYILDNARLNILDRVWSRSIIENGKLVGLVSLDLSEFNIRGYAGIWIARIKTPEKFRRQGYANQAMKALLGACKFNGVDVYLAINGYDGGMNFNQLYKWYQRLGFKQVPGEEKGFMRFECSRLFQR